MRSATAVLAAATLLASTANAQPYVPDTLDLTPQRGSSRIKNQVVDSEAALNWKDINIVHITDVHSYVSGHRHGEATVSSGWGDSWGLVPSAVQDADYADLLSFIEHMKDTARSLGKDLWIVNTGDVVDGTGISNLTPVNGANLLPLLQALPFDAVTIGNHELYKSSTVANLASSGFIDHWAGNYVTSNVLSADATALAAGKSVGDTLGAPYVVLQGEFNRSILVLGFLYNMDDHCDNVEVVHVEESVTQPWFAEAMAAAANVDAVIALSHMDLVASEVAAIRAAVHAAPGCAGKPLTFMAGHSHYRRFNVYDDRTAAIESGNYFNTVGWLAYDIPPPGSKSSPLDYDWRMIDANKATMASTVGVPQADFMTPAGNSLRDEILSTRRAMGLDDVLGCNPGVTMAPGGDMTDPTSVWGFVMSRVVPDIVFDPPNNPDMWEVESTGGLRAPLYYGGFTTDDLFALSPFGNRYFAIDGVPGATVALLYNYLVYGGGGDCDSCGHRWDGHGKPPFACTDMNPNPARTYTVILTSYDKDRAIGPALAAVDPRTDWIATARPYRQDEITSSLIYKHFACRAPDWACPERSSAACVLGSRGGSAGDADPIYVGTHATTTYKLDSGDGPDKLLVCIAGARAQRR